MRGMNKDTGKALDGVEHLWQSIQDILWTAPQTLVIRRDYGSNLQNLIDAPINAETLIELYAATIEAIEAWEPRISITRVYTESLQSGEISLIVEGCYRHNGEAVVLEGLTLEA